MQTTADKRRRILLLFLLGIGLPSFLLGYLAFRGVRNDQALLERQSVSGLWRISAEGGEPQRLELAVDNLRATPTVHPDGQRIAFTAGQHKAEVWVMENVLPDLEDK